MEKCQETLKGTVGEERWSSVGLWGASAMLIVEKNMSVDPKHRCFHLS